MNDLIKKKKNLFLVIAVEEWTRVFCFKMLNSSDNHTTIGFQNGFFFSFCFKDEGRCYSPFVENIQQPFFPQSANTSKETVTSLWVLKFL